MTKDIDTVFYSLEKNTIDIYYTSIHNAQLPQESSPKCLMLEDSSALRDFLNAEEIGCLNKIKSKKRRLELIYSRLLAKSLIAYNLDTAPKEILFLTDSYGKPYLAGCEDIKFNLTHSGSFIACAAMLNHDIGIDVEETKRDITCVAKAFFCEDEIAYIRSIAQEFRNDAACRLWTMKEAYVKALGKGLSIPFDSFDVLNDEATLFYTMQPDKCCYLSVAVPHMKNRLTVRIKKINIECEPNIRLLAREDLV